MKRTWTQCLALLFSLIFLFSSFVAHAEQYICIANKSTGFKYDNNKKSWKYARFISEDKYIIKQTKPTNTNSYSSYEVTMVGDKLATYRCGLNTNDDPIISCKSRVSLFPNVFYYSKITGYFQEYVHGTLVTGQKDGTPSITIGKCSPF